METIFNEEQTSFILSETEKLLDKLNIAYERKDGGIITEKEENQKMVDNFTIHAKAYAVTQGVITPAQFSQSMY